MQMSLAATRGAALVRGAKQELMEGQQAFVQLLGAAFDVSTEAATRGYAQLRSFVQSNGRLERLFQAASGGRAKTSFDDTYDEVQHIVVRMDLTAIVRQVIMPMAGGYLGYAVAGALGATGAVPVIIGVLIAAIIYLMMAPGTWRMIKARIDEAVDNIFRPTLDW
jgi:hypothetical protein